MNKLNALFIATPLLFLVSQAHAEAIDLSGITENMTNIALVGAAVFGVHLAIKGFKWVRSAI